MFLDERSLCVRREVKPWTQIIRVHQKKASYLWDVEFRSCHVPRPLRRKHLSIRQQFRTRQRLGVRAELAGAGGEASRPPAALGVNAGWLLVLNVVVAGGGAIWHLAARRLA